jgi:polyhydroxyalkanoate synthesis regulator phasin
MTDENEPGEEGYVQLNVRVPREAKEQASEKLPHGGLTREVRERIEEIATGRRSDVEELRGELEELRDERRAAAARVEELEIEIERTERELLEVVREQVGWR